jgi:hypothetical protein
LEAEEEEEEDFVNRLDNENDFSAFMTRRRSRPSFCVFLIFGEIKLGTRLRGTNVDEKEYDEHIHDERDSATTPRRKYFTLIWAMLIFQLGKIIDSGE